MALLTYSVLVICTTYGPATTNNLSISLVAIVTLAYLRPTLQ